MSVVLHLLARARDIPEAAETDCAICGRSPFGPGRRSARDVMGPNFTDHEHIADPLGGTVCAGCDHLLGGRPGDIPAPYRMRSHLAVPGQPDQELRHDAVEAVLRAPPAQFALVWSRTGKRHACLHAGPSAPERIVIGTETGPVVYRPAEHGSLLDAVAVLRSRFPRDAIASGHYPEPLISRFGTARWAENEAVVSPHRPSALLDLLCAIAQPAAPPDPEVILPTDPNDRAAANVLAALAGASAIRARDGKMFWGGFYRHRVQRFAHLPLNAGVSRLADAIGASATTTDMSVLLRWLDEATDEQRQGVESALRERGALCVALAYDEIQRRRGR